MRLDELTLGRQRSVEVTRPPGDAAPLPTWPPGVEIALSITDGGEVLLRAGAQALAVCGIDPTQERALREVAESGLPRVCWLVRRRDRGRQALLIQIHEFQAAHRFTDQMDLAVDDKIVEDLRARYCPQVRDAAAAIAWLQDRLLLGPRDPDLGPALGPALPRVLLSARSVQGDRRGPGDAFRLVGAQVAVDVRRDEEDRLRVTRVVRPRRDLAPVLCEAPLRLCDVSVAARFHGAARTTLDELVQRAAGYLSLWAEYQALERASIQRRAQAFGHLRYTRRDRLPDEAWRFYLELPDGVTPVSERLQDAESEDLELAADAVLPDALARVTVSEYSTARGGRDERPEFCGRYLRHSESPHTLDVKPGDEDTGEPPSAGFLFVSQRGDHTRMRRRDEALQTVREATGPMPQLALLLEGLPVPTGRHRLYDSLSPEVRAVFEGAPTENQAQALRIALNTPDIALIQGPPGTGKTRTIAALQTRLAQIFDAQEGMAGQILLSSFQHDAVEEAASKTKVLGLPAVKIGRREDQREHRDGVADWVEAQKLRLRDEQALRPERPCAARLRALRALLTGYLLRPTDAVGTAALLDRVRAQCVDLLGGDLLDRMQRRAQDLRCQQAVAWDSAREACLRAARGLRYEPGPFADDGPARAGVALLRLGDRLDPSQRAVLQRAASCPDDAPPQELLDALRTLREALQLTLQAPPPPPAVPLVDAETEALLSEAVGSAAARIPALREGVGAALDVYLDDLENDPDGAREALRRYTVVLAATCQQSVSHQMLDQLLDGRRTWNTVIIDEAARANPLDLLIPMARAERRIILVGDHKQLPHILEPDVERDLDRGARAETRTVLRQSLFERLYEELRRREAQDGVRRTIRLNTQFRMHPVLGDLISEQFYDGELRSGRPAAGFLHQLGRYRKGDREAVAAWIDVPHDRGEDRRQGTSRKRLVEAQVLAEELRQLLREAPHLRFGVITFYKAQEGALWRALRDVGLAEERDPGQFTVAARYRRTTGEKPAERLRIGTVDAFQGREFDVVLLSMTRSNRVRWAADAPEDEREAALRRKYGRLMLTNLQCVAMSRQMRLLVVVGDAAMVRDPAAAHAVPALRAFHHLCEGPHGRCC